MTTTNRSLERARIAAESTAVTELAAAITEYQQLLYQESELEAKLKGSVDRLKKARRTLGIDQVSPRRVTRGKEAPKKRKVDIYKEIILENGRPMRCHDLLVAINERGVVLNGKNKPVEQLRNALSNSKLFENVGGNTWWVIEKPLPEPVIQTSALGEVFRNMNDGLNDDLEGNPEAP